MHNQTHSRYQTLQRPAGLLIAVTLLISGACTPASDPPDYDLYKNMRAYAEETLTDAGAVQRDEFPELFSTAYDIDLTGIFRLVFGSSALRVHLASYESPAIAAGSLSQFEVPPGSENYTDFAFVIRPAANLRAPMVHGDALKAMAGMNGSFSMDFYNVNKDAVDLDEFFGDQLEKIQQGLALVEPYQRQGEDRGKYISHLQEYTSDVYRIEIDESYIPGDGETERAAYYAAALEAYQLFMDAYFTALARLEPEDDPALIEANKAGIDTFIDILYEFDFAASLGKQLFQDDFDTYFLEGFWRDGFYGAGL
jgi:hypothetical protein